AARAAAVARAGSARRGGRAQPPHRAPPGAGRRAGGGGRRHRVGALRGRRVSMTTAVEVVQDAPLTIGGRTFPSRLLVGTGKYRDSDTMVRAIEASGAAIVTVAVRRVNLDRTKEEGILYHLDPKKYFLLANTAGCAAVMPLASPIGSGLGLLNPFSVRAIKRRVQVPVIVDAGVGTASDACITMEQGVDGILMNTALAAARDPVAMAHAMRLAVEAGRAAFLAGRMPRREVALPSSPAEGMLD